MTKKSNKYKARQREIIDGHKLFDKISEPKLRPSLNRMQELDHKKYAIKSRVEKESEKNSHL